MNFRHGFLTVAVVLAASSPGFTAEDLSPESRQNLRFVQGLRERGYHDLALEYLQMLRTNPDTSPDLKLTLDYQEGRGLLEEATVSSNTEKKIALLDAARTKLDQFAREHPQHPLTPDALTQLARLYVERGHTAILQSRDLTGAEAGAKLAAARSALNEARAAYDRALPALQSAFDAFPKFIPDGNPRREAKALAQTSLMNARLQKAVVDYEEAQSYTQESKERKDLLDRAGEAFEQVYKDYRTQLAGLSAHMLRGKCYEEKGEYGRAMGIYNELAAQPMNDAQYNEMRRTIGFYRIIVTNKRKEYALAVDEAARWLQENPRNLVSESGLGVQLELAKALIALLPDMKDADKEEALRKAGARLDEVVRYFSPYKAEALELRQKFRPKTTLTDRQILAMSYEEAMAQADSAMASHEWDRAIGLLKQAVRKADPAKDAPKANKARYFMAYCEYSANRYYDAAILAEHLARRYPKDELSAKATEIGLAAYTLAYMRYNRIDRESDLRRLRDLADYTASTWPDTDQGDGARVQIGEIEMGMGHYAESAAAYEAVRVGSPRRLDAQVKAGDAHWRSALKLREQGKTAEAETQEKTALALTKSALDARKAAGIPPTDPALIVNTNALAEIYRGTAKPKEALALLEPLAKSLEGQTLSSEVAPLYDGLLTVMLQAHIADGQTSKAIGDMKALEKAGGSKAKLTQLYLELSRSLQAEMEAQAARKDRVALERTRKAFKEFLQALAGSESGQTFDSLLFAGNAMLEMEMVPEALGVFEKMLKTYENDAQFKQNPNSATSLLLLKLKKAIALRKSGKFEDGLKLDDALITENPRQIEPLMEKGMLLEDWAKTRKVAERWNASYAYWTQRATQLERIRPRRPEYFECIYHVAVALAGLDRKPDAVRALKGAMTFTPNVGTPEIKAKYTSLLKQLGG